ncbi:altronate dehydratase [Tessaracoccus rhinocerotis]|uniref:Altronate dehydratase n=1 Tax=Tessaracoccus rhinocerotis TaxID=1689449 RepID=A0A553K5Z6_9ACTN|nr:altronate dehydratase family protein [Tessaracoccus rhinocerotis]TRY20127.1 altronate dehydratase [Tessaracoccus rhinocerotis]
MSEIDGLHILGPGDDVGVVIREGGPVPVGHKVAVHDVAAGSPVIKYGHVIGYATRDIAVGDHVHSHNLTYGDHGAPEHGATAAAHPPELTLDGSGTFKGIRRSDGRVATRNVIAIVSTVNCSATVCQRIADAVTRAGILEDFDGIDAVVPVTHTSGCGMSGDGDNLRRLRRTLAGYAGHANVGGVLVVALGCEVNQMTDFMADIPRRDDLHILELGIQDMGGTRATIDAGIRAVEQLARDMGEVTREDFPVSELVMGLNCGGSDGWSGITANPALGVASDMLVARGGRSVLAETPEIYGAEDLLLNRAVSDGVAQKLRDIIARWESDVEVTGESLDNNPSPGNKEGGITTILEKSLGAVAKGGHSPMAAVYEYAEPIDEPGFGFMDTPGYDPVSVTGLIAGGANVVVFTTGRGSALGYGIVPVVKVSTNSTLFRRMPDDMDLDAGDIVEQGVPVADKGREIYERIVSAASGERTRSEDLGYGSQEFVPWLLGPVF